MIIFMNKAIVEEKTKTVKFKGANWNVTFSQALRQLVLAEVTSTSNIPEEPTFNVSSY